LHSVPGAAPVRGQATSRRSGKGISAPPSVSAGLRGSTRQLLRTREASTTRGRSFFRRLGSDQVQVSDTSAEDGKVAVKAAIQPDGDKKEEKIEGVSKRASSPESRIAVAQKIRKARELARKLAAESAALAKAASVEEVDSKEKAEEEASLASEEAAKIAADAAESDAAVRSASKPDAPMFDQLTKLQVENEALRKILIEMAYNKDEVVTRLAALSESLDLAALDDSTDKAAAATAAAKKSAEDAKRALAEANAVGMEDEITKVVMELQVAKKIQEEAVNPIVLAKKALKAKQPFFCAFPDGCPVGQKSQVYYNREAGPCPKGRPLVFKAGLNGWESIVELGMSRAERLQNADVAGDWMVVDVDFNEDTFKVAFVVMCPETGDVDNNMSRDFDLPLIGAPTEEEVIKKRLCEFEEAEAKRREVVEREESRLLLQVEEDAKVAALKAAEKLRLESTMKMQVEAEQVAMKRRPKWLSSLRLESERGNIFRWAVEPQGGKPGRLLYNKASGPLKNARGAVVHVGYDGWFQEDKQIITMQSVSKDKYRALKLNDDGKAEWFECKVEVPQHAFVLNFVFSSEDMYSWDNGSGGDFHSAVRGAKDIQALAAELFEQMRKERAAELAEAEERCKRLTVRKVKKKAEAARMRRDRQRQIMYTDPLFPKAGDEVEIFYNQENTVLNGRPEIWARGSWNRWEHNECWMPIRMVPAAGGIIKSEKKLKVPEDACLIDMIFSDSGDMQGGFFDNNKGFDYHIPVTGATRALRPLKVVHVSVEMAPIAKVGGMGDVVTALGRAVQDEGHDVTVILPKYDIINYDNVKDMREEMSFHWGGCNNKVWRGTVEELDVVFLEPENGNFWVGCIYGRNDDAARFGFFNGIAAEYIARSNMNPDVVHCHDWQTAPTVFNGGPGKKVFTIHNLNYGADLIGKAMSSCDVGTTVSPTYASEIGGHPAIAGNLNKLYGVINGIDADFWDPSQDKFLPMQYSSEEAVEGKAAARKELRNRFGLAHSDVPVVGVVTRLTHQKGIHLIKHAAWRTLERGGQFVLLGSAPDPRLQAEFNALSNDLARQYPDRARLWFAFDEPLSHLMYAGSDMILVPSMFEPCGLTQMIAMSYGAIPVVRRTGGLNDSVFDVDHDQERAEASGKQVNGFNFEGTDTGAIDYALNRAMTMWFQDREAWNNLTKQVMEQDWSWNSPALDYLEIYYKAMKN